MSATDAEVGHGYRCHDRVHDRAVPANSEQARAWDGVEGAHWADRAEAEAEVLASRERAVPAAAGS